MNERVYVMDRKRQYKAILTGIDWRTFCVSWSKNNVPQLDFSVYINNSYGYTLLTNENIVEYRGQQYVIKTYNPNYSGGIDTITITAIHVGAECQYIYQPNKKAGNNSWNISDAMHWLFDNNNLGFTWEIKGNFGNCTLQDFGACNAKSGLSTIKSSWNAEVVFNNRHIIVMDENTYLHKINHTIRYQHDTADIQLQGDSTGLVNKIYCTSTQDDKGNWKNFQPFWSYNQDSINRWGEHCGDAMSSDVIATQAGMDAEAKAHMVLDPQFAITVTWYGSTIPDFGEQWYLEILPMDLKLWVEVTGYKIYPFAPSQNGEIDLDSLKPNILNINQSLQSNVSKAISAAQNANGTTNVVNVGVATIDAGKSEISYDG